MDKCSSFLFLGLELQFLFHVSLHETSTLTYLTALSGDAARETVLALVVPPVPHELLTDVLHSVATKGRAVVEAACHEASLAAQ